MQQNSDGMKFPSPASSTYYSIITTSAITTASLQPITTFSQTASVVTPMIASPLSCTEIQFSQPEPNQPLNNLTWQEVPARRNPKRTLQNDNNNSQVKKINSTNRFAALSEETDISEETTENNQPDISTENKPKPPPIYIQNVTNYPLMVDSILTVLLETEFICKTQLNNTVKVNTSSTEAYRELVRFLRQQDISHYTYQLRNERAYRVVIKNLHHSAGIDDIKDELENKGFQIRNITNIKSWKNKEPLPMFFVDQEPNENNKKIYELKYLLNTKIIVEPPRNKKQIPQCLRCQDYGHTRAYCNKPFNCVKCAGNHKTSECQKTKTTPAKCVHCSGPHPANYKGCQAYRELQKSKIRIPVSTTRAVENAAEISKIKDNVSYAQIIKSPNSNTQDNNDAIITQFLNKFEVMFNQLMNQNNMIINLLTKLVTVKN